MDAPVETTVPIARGRAPPRAPSSVTRAVGLGLLGICAFAMLRLRISVAVLPRHPPSLAEMLLSLTAVLTGMGGAMAAFIGPALFRSHPRPPRGGSSRNDQF
jgi:hypothetical protein